MNAKYTDMHPLVDSKGEPAHISGGDLITTVEETGPILCRMRTHVEENTIDCTGLPLLLS